jgi:hypothetical protein
VGSNNHQHDRGGDFRNHLARWASPMTSLADRMVMVLEAALQSDLGIEIRCSDPRRMIALLHSAKRASLAPDAARIRIQQSPWPDRSDLVIWKVPLAEVKPRSLAQLVEGLDL